MLVMRARQGLAPYVARIVGQLVVQRYPHARPAPPHRQVLLAAHPPCHALVFLDLRAHHAINALVDIGRALLVKEHVTFVQPTPGPQQVVPRYLIVKRCPDSTEQMARQRPLVDSTVSKGIWGPAHVWRVRSIRVR